MPAYKVAWQQPAQVTATVTVDLDQLAQWAVEVGGVRALTETGPGPGELAGVRLMLERNRHLRDDLLRQWARAHMPHS